MSDQLNSSSEDSSTRRVTRSSIRNDESSVGDQQLPPASRRKRMSVDREIISNTAVLNSPRRYPTRRLSTDDHESRDGTPIRRSRRVSVDRENVVGVSKLAEDDLKPTPVRRGRRVSTDRETNKSPKQTTTLEPVTENPDVEEEETPVVSSPIREKPKTKFLDRIPATRHSIGFNGKKIATTASDDLNKSMDKNFKQKSPLKSCHTKNEEDEDSVSNNASLATNEEVADDKLSIGSLSVEECEEKNPSPKRRPVFDSIKTTFRHSIGLLGAKVGLSPKKSVNLNKSLDRNFKSTERENTHIADKEDSEESEEEEVNDKDDSNEAIEDVPVPTSPAKPVRSSLGKSSSEEIENDDSNEAAEDGGVNHAEEAGDLDDAEEDDDMDSQTTENPSTESKEPTPQANAKSVTEILSRCQNFLVNKATEKAEVRVVDEEKRLRRKEKKELKKKKRAEEIQLKQERIEKMEREKLAKLSDEPKAKVAKLNKPLNGEQQENRAPKQKLKIVTSQNITQLSANLKKAPKQDVHSKPVTNGDNHIDTKRKSDLSKQRFQEFIQDQSKQQAKKAKKPRRDVKEPLRVLPKPVWTSSGEFEVEDVNSPLKIKSTKQKQGFQVEVVSGKTATGGRPVNFKEQFLYRKDVRREPAHNLLKRKHFD